MIESKPSARSLRRWPSLWGWLLSVLGVLSGLVVVDAQFQMPDPKQMSGIPRPVTDLPSGSVSVRLIKGELSNNLVGHPVELHINDRVETVKTDDAGRAQFDNLPAGATLRARAVVEGEPLESETFPAPAQGGIRVMLVATDKEKEAQKAAEASAPPIQGTVALAGDSRIVIEPGDESLSVFYLLEIVNAARSPVMPPTPFEFDTPARAIGTSVMQGSSPLATNAEHRVQVAGPFPPGRTRVQIGMSVPVDTDTIELSQAFPAPLESLVLIAKKEGAMQVSSPQIQQQRDTAVDGTPVIVGMGGAIAANQPLTITISGLPHHSAVPRRVTLTLALGVLLAGAWFATRPQDQDARGAERKRLTGRREKLLQELVRLEQDHRRGRVESTRFQGRRDELMAALEHVYGALEADDLAPA